MLNSKGEIRHPCFIPGHRKNLQSFTNEKDANYRFLQVPCMGVRKFPSCPSLLSVFMMNGCEILSSPFSVATHGFSLLRRYIQLHD